VEVAWAEHQGQDKEQADTRIQSQTDSTPHQCLAESTGKGEKVAEEVELGNFVGMGQETPNVGTDGMDADVQPAADGIVRGVLPSLKAIAMAQVMGRFPVVEGLIAVLDRRKQGSNHVCTQKHIKR